MLESYFKHLATNFRNFPKISEDIPRISKISDNFRRFHKKIKMLKGHLEHFGTFSDFSEDFRRLLKISEDFQKLQKLVGMFVFALSGAFS